MSATLNGSVSWDVGSVTDQSFKAQDITVTGVALGDFVLVSSSLDVADLWPDAQVTAANVVTCVFANLTTAGVDPLTPTLYVQVTSRAGLT